MMQEISAPAQVQRLQPRQPCDLAQAARHDRVVSDLIEQRVAQRGLCRQRRQVSKAEDEV